MSKLEDIVPPLDLCKQIPAGAFEDSALVWSIRYGIPGDRIVNLIQRKDYHNGGFIVPAPTLAEILLALSESGNAYTSKNEVGCVVLHEIPGDEEWYGYSMRTETDKNNYATAALKLWLELEAKK